MEIHKRVQFLWTDINSQSSTPPRVLIDLLLLALQWLFMYYKGFIAIRGFLCKTYSEYEHWAEYLQELSELNAEIHKMREAAKTNIKKLNSIILGLSGKEENYETRVLAFRMSRFQRRARSFIPFETHGLSCVISTFRFTPAILFSIANVTSSVVG